MIIMLVYGISGFIGAQLAGLVLSTTATAPRPWETLQKLAVCPTVERSLSPSFWGAVIRNSSKANF